MTETVIKGSGNSRSIKSVPNLAQLAPTYDKLLELLTGEGLPVDLGPLNPAGLAQRGTDLNKASLLSDETAALYPDLPEDPTVDDALARIGPYLPKIDEKIRIVTGSYIGTGTYGPDSPNSITFPFPPIVACLSSAFYKSNEAQSLNMNTFWLIDRFTKTTFVRGMGFAGTRSGSTKYGKKSADGRTLYWYIETDGNYGPGDQRNWNGYEYTYFAIG